MFKRNEATFELGRLLAELLTQRDSGLLPQSEYEQKLNEFRRVRLTPDEILYERDLSNGGTRFILRQRSTGRCLQMFEFRRSYSSECSVK